MELNSWILCVGILLYLIMFSISTRAKARKPPPPPGPRPLPFFGNLFMLGEQPHRSMASLAKLHGPIMTLKLGLTTTIVISSPELAKEALQKKDNLLSDRWVPEAVQVLDFHQGSMIFSLANQHWKQLRSICSTNLFSNKSLEASKHLRKQKVSELLEYFSSHAGCPVDVGNAMFSMIVDLMSALLFSMDGEHLSSKCGLNFKELVSTLTEEAGKPNISDFFPFLRVFDLQDRKKLLSKHLSNLFNLFDKLIDSRLSSQSAGMAENADFLDSLLLLHLEAKLKRLTIKSFLADLFVAAVDTTSITLEWAMTELLRNPSTLARAQAELKQVIGSSIKQLEETDITQLPYLQAVLKEVLRLHPPGPLLLPHQPVQDVELGGYLVPKGTRVMVNVWAIGHDEQVWAQPEKFIPERFLNKEIDYRGQYFDLIPFGSGRRSCPGLPLAARMLPFTLASLLHAFDWKLEDGMEPCHVDVKEKFGITLAKAVPLRAVAIPIACY